jgi:tetratricopeptide (TPR) repeat protein
VSDRRRPPRGGLAGLGMESMTLARQSVGALAICSFAIGVAACGSPPTATSLVAQGLRAQLSGNVSTAENEYEQAIKLDRNNVIAHYDLGTVYDKQGSTARAVGEYRAALVIDPTFADALFNLAVDTTSADPHEAAQLYLKVLSLQPTYAAAWLNVGFILRSEGKAGEARPDWAQAVVLDPSLAARVPTATQSNSGAVTTKPSPTPTP